MFLSEEFRAFLTKLMNSLSDLLEGVNLDFNFDLMPGVGVAGYVLLALGLFTIAKRRKLQNAWMAWVPVLNLWLLGCISDQYRYVTRGQTRNIRTVLLLLGIAEVILNAVLFVLALFGLGGFLQNLISAYDLMPASWKLLKYAALGLLFSCFCKSLRLVRCFALHDIYSSCLPKRKTLFTVLSILGYVTGADVVPALLVFLCRNKEEGMPPRIEE
jgi:hypothetical protein